MKTSISRLSILPAFILLSGISSFTSLTAQGVTDLPFPRLANCYLRNEVREKDVNVFSGWDLLIFGWTLDRNEAYRENLSRIKEENPDAVFLLYHTSIGANSTVSPPDSIYTLAQRYDWWLYDYQGNKISFPGWEYDKILNFTNTEAAKGSNPDGLKPNSFLPDYLVNEHVLKYDYWDGIFYDVYSDNLRWVSRDIKDATLNQVAEHDTEHNEGEPLFDTLWREGMLTLAQNTIGQDSSIIMVGNGLNRYATPYLNGIMCENYSPSSKDLSDLASIQRYLVETGRDQAISIINGMVRNENPTDYQSMRFTMTSTLLTDAFFSCDFGSQDHAETLWFDEFTVYPTGEVAALTTMLTEDINAEQDRVPVASTAGFPSTGVIQVDGEEIYYAAKSDTEFLDCQRGYPHVTEKYDLRSPHDKDAPVVHYLNDRTGYLGHPVSDAYDVNDPSVKLKDLFADAGWYAVGDDAVNINSRVWRRDFDNGIVVMNPSGETRTISGLGEGTYRKIKGIQDPAHNDGELVHDTLTIAPQDGYILLKHQDDQDPPEAPHGLTIIE
jgi:hypothetical protein